MENVYEKYIREQKEKFGFFLPFYIFCLFIREERRKELRRGQKKAKNIYIIREAKINGHKKERLGQKRDWGKKKPNISLTKGKKRFLAESLVFFAPA